MTRVAGIFGRNRFNFSPRLMKIGVVGGGISGLSAAFYLSKWLPKHEIHLFESSSRFGGWIHSSKVQQNCFELGTRTLTPKATNVFALAELVC